LRKAGISPTFSNHLKDLYYIQTKLAF